jgi:hypothetical protein
MTAFGVNTSLDCYSGSAWVNLEVDTANHLDLFEESIIWNYTRSNTIENLTFTGNQNITRYLQVPQNTFLTNARMNLSGYNYSDGTALYLEQFKQTGYQSLYDLFSNSTNIFSMNAESGAQQNFTIYSLNMTVMGIIMVLIDFQDDVTFGVICCLN